MDPQVGAVGARARSSPQASTISSLGATPDARGTRFVIWSTRAREVSVRILDSIDTAGRVERMSPRGEGLFEVHVEGVGPGALYTFVLDGRAVPDPYARFLPYGVHGPARVEPVRQREVAVRDARWQAPPFGSWVLYELHVGSFTPEGTWDGARARLDALVDLGVNAVEVMPIAAFDGRRGWGYDGVALFAPHAGYGEPDAVRRFVHACHERGLAAVLDVVYNHFGPSGNYLSAYAPEYFTDRHVTAWGNAPDFREPHMRSLVLDNARYWLEEFGFDGLRLDATHAIADDTSPHVVRAVADLAASLGRVVVAEDERNDPTLVTRDGARAIWADDFHHEVHALLTGESDGYYAAYEPSAAALARTIERGWLYEGQVFGPSRKPRGRPADDLDATHFVYAIQNHDQIGNRPSGDRLHHGVEPREVMSAALLLLSLPMVPLLFMGQEWCASTRFPYFTDHAGELGRAIVAGREREFAHFRGFGDGETEELDPQAEDTFRRSILQWSERDQGVHAWALGLYRHLLRLRREDPVLSRNSRADMSCEARGALLIVRRWEGADERVVLWNTGPEPAPLPSALTHAAVLATTAEAPDPLALPAKRAALLRPAR